MASAAERTLAAEWLGIMLVQVGDAIYEKTSGDAPAGTGFLPAPSQFFATMIVFLFLSGGAAFSERFGKLASAFGGLTLLALGLYTPKGRKYPPVIGFLRWLTSMVQNPPRTGTAVGGGPASPLAGGQSGSSYTELQGGPNNAPATGTPASSTYPSTRPIPGAPQIPSSAYYNPQGLPVNPT